MCFINATRIEKKILGRVHIFSVGDALIPPPDHILVLFSWRAGGKQGVEQGGNAEREGREIGGMF